MEIVRDGRPLREVRDRAFGRCSSAGRGKAGSKTSSASLRIPNVVLRRGTAKALRQVPELTRRACRIRTCDQRIKSRPLTLQRFVNQQLTRTPVASFAAPCRTLRSRLTQNSRKLRLARDTNACRHGRAYVTRARSPHRSPARSSTALAPSASLHRAPAPHADSDVRQIKGLSRNCPEYFPVSRLFRSVGWPFPRMGSGQASTTSLSGSSSRQIAPNRSHQFGARPSSASMAPRRLSSY